MASTAMRVIHGSAFDTALTPRSIRNVGEVVVGNVISSRLTLEWLCFCCNPLFTSNFCGLLFGHLRGFIFATSTRSRVTGHHNLLRHGVNMQWSYRLLPRR